MLKVHCIDKLLPNPAGGGVALMGVTLCGVKFQRLVTHIPVAGEYDVATGKLSRGCRAVSARDFEPDPRKCCEKCATKWGEGLGYDERTP